MKHRSRELLIAAILTAGTFCSSSLHAEKSKPVVPLDHRALAAKIDEHIAARWIQAKTTPAPLADDAEFARRVYLDLAGRIPLTAEIRAFLAETSPDKRERLVERILSGPAYINHFTNVYRALLLPEVETNFNVRFLQSGFEAWLRQHLVRNTHYDALVRELLTIPFDGDARRLGGPAPQNGQTNPIAFYQAKENKPENLAASTARIFLGVRLECAQCHDHPFATWKRDQFWGQAAFFAGLQSQNPDNGAMMARQEARDRRELLIPGTERVAQASFLDGAEPRWRFKTGSRQILAEWMTASTNPYFARTAANRMWAHCFGIGLVEPIDDFSDDHPPSHPELLQDLARQFVAHQYDLKYLLKAITASRAYQLTSRRTHASQDEPRLFARMAVKGLSPEQIYDSVAAATGLREITPAAGRQANRLNADSPRGRFLAKFATPEKRTEAETSILQALFLMNGKVIADATSLERSETLAAVAEAPFLDHRQKVETLYFAALSRPPSAEESDRLERYVVSGGPKSEHKAALADVFWALLNSTEFILNH